VSSSGSESRTGRLERDGEPWGYVHCAGDRVSISGATEPRELDLGSSERFWLSRGDLVVDDHALRVTWLEGEEAERVRAEHFPGPASPARRSMRRLVALMITIDGLAALVVVGWWLAAGDPPLAVIGIAAIASVLAIPFSWIERREEREESFER
jgi:hypothetical protein